MRLKMFLYVIIACCWGKTLSIPQHLINEFKASLLPLFGFKERPKLEGHQRTQVPEAIREMYEVQTNLEYDTASLALPGLHTKSANTVRSFIHVESPFDEKFLNHHKFRLKFDISSIPKDEKLKAAEIKLTRESLTDIDSSPYQRILVHDILQRGIKGSHGPITRLIDSQVIDTRRNSTVSVDVFPAVERWLTNPKSNHGVLIIVLGSGGKKSPPKKHLRLRRDVAVSDWWQKQPLLFTYTDDGKNKQRSGEEMTKIREKRATKRHRKYDRDPCRRRQMYVDFRDVGWNDWIVAPLGYDAFYCEGTCDYPMPEHLNTTNHAIVQSLFNSMKPSEVPKPCCVPTQLSSISMLYVANGGNIILKNYKEMVVVGCGCR